MRGMNVNRHVSARIILLSLVASACATQPDPRTHEIDFVQGCWIQKDAPGGTIQAFLRLLPSEADGNETTYSGEIQDVTLDRPGDPMEGVSFARDGSSASWWILLGSYSDDPDVTVVPGGAHDTFERTYNPALDSGRHQYRAVFRSIYVPDGTLVVESTAEQLKITRNGVETIFYGERDGCD